MEIYKEENIYQYHLRELGYIAGYLGVYLGALQLAKTDALIRIDYSLIDDHDSMCKCLLPVVQIVMRSLILLLFFMVFMFGPQKIQFEFIPEKFTSSQFYWMWIVYSFLPTYLMSYMLFRYYERACAALNMDVNFF